MATPVVGATAVVTASALNGRVSPPGGEVKHVRKKGSSFTIRARKKVGKTWWVRAGTLWYSGDYIKMKVYKRVVDTGVLNVRNKPTTRGSKVVGRHKRGYVLKCVDEVKGNDGNVWLKSIYGSYYAKEYTRPYKVASSSSRPSSKPAKVSTPVPGWKATTPFKKRPNGWPNRHTYWRQFGYHDGIDWAAPNGAKVVSVLDGKIYRYKDSVLGNVALLYADNGDTYWFCHLSRYAVSNGKRVKAGQVIGYVGSTGTGAMGPHLHVSRRNGHSTTFRKTPLDPAGGW